MIVECGNCKTRFQLDDSRVPDRGIRVRCSRCKEAFFLERPGTSEAEAIDDIAAEAAASANPGSPEPTRDLAAPEEDAPPGRAESDDGDWQFNDDFPGINADDDSGSLDLSDDGAQTADEESFYDHGSVGDLAGDDDVPGLDADEGIDLDTAGEIGEVGTDLSIDPSEADGGLDLDAGGLDVSAELASEPAADLSADAGGDNDFSSLIDDDEAPPAAAPAPPAAASPAQAGGDDWDFFSEEEEPALAPPLSAPAARSAGESNASGPTAYVPTDSGLLERGRSGLLGVVRAVGWCLTLTLLGVGLVRGLFPVAVVGGSTSAALGVLEANEVTGSWLDTARAGTLYTVRATLRNPGAQPIMPGALRASLLDAEGRPLELAPAVVGLSLAEAELREHGADQLHGTLGRTAAQLARMPLPAGASVQVMAIFQDVPDQAQRFELHVDPSQPQGLWRPPPPPMPVFAPDPMGEAGSPSHATLGP